MSAWTTTGLLIVAALGAVWWWLQWRSRPKVVKCKNCGLHFEPVLVNYDERGAARCPVCDSTNLNGAG